MPRCSPSKPPPTSTVSNRDEAPASAVCASVPSTAVVCAEPHGVRASTEAGSVGIRVGSIERAAMNSLRKSIPAIAGLVLAAAFVVGGASSALAAPPYPNGGQATALVGGTPLIQASCTTAPAQSTGASVLGTARVANASASCTPQATAVGGSYSLDGTTPALQFAAQCVNSSNATGGAVIVPT